jgi:hypothetical protein
VAKTKQAKKQPRSGHQTQWTAQFAVASELCKMGHQVALTMGNHPEVDLMVVSPKGVHFDVDVKGQYQRNFWPVKVKRTRDDLFYVFTRVPEGKPNTFFILAQDQVNKGIKADRDNARRARKPKGKDGEPVEFQCISSNS